MPGPFPSPEFVQRINEIIREVANEKNNNQKECSTSSKQ